MCPPIGLESAGGISKFVAQITRMDANLIGYWMAGQLKTMRSSVMRNNKSRIGDMTLRRILMIPCEM